MLPARCLTRCLLVALAGLALAGVGSIGCRGRRPPPAAAPRAASAGAPSFTFEPAAYTYERDNRNHTLETQVTVGNPSSERVRVAWAELKAAADAPLAGPRWHGAAVPPELGPGENVTATVSWYYVGGGHPRPAAIRVRYAPTGLARELPVRVLPTSGFGLRLSLPARAVLAAQPPPLRGQAWEVRVPLEVRNPRGGPLMFVPFWFQATAGDQTVSHVGETPPFDGALRLEPGASARGTLLWRLRGTSPAPTRLRVTFPAADRPELAETIAVLPAER